MDRRVAEGISVAVPKYAHGLGSRRVDTSTLHPYTREVLYQALRSDREVAYLEWVSAGAGTGKDLPEEASRKFEIAMCDAWDRFCDRVERYSR